MIPVEGPELVGQVPVLVLPGILLEPHLLVGGYGPSARGRRHCCEGKPKWTPQLTGATSENGPVSDVGQLMTRRAEIGSGATRLDGGKTLHFL